METLSCPDMCQPIFQKLFRTLDLRYVSKYQNIAIPEMYHDTIQLRWYIDIFCSVQFIQFDNESILLTSYMKRFSLFSTNAMH